MPATAPTADAANQALDNSHRPEILAAHAFEWFPEPLIYPATLTASVFQVEKCQREYELFRALRLERASILGEVKRREKEEQGIALTDLVDGGYTKTDAPKFLHKSERWVKFQDQLIDYAERDSEADTQLSIARNRLNTARLFLETFLPARPSKGDSHN